MPNPQLTIGMPVYNDVDFIEESLNSILNQTYGNFKLIISDDCSTDGSLNIIEQFAKKDSRIEVIRQTKNLGISKNMELLLEKAQTPYFMWAGDDDIMKETFVEKLMTALEQNSTYVAAFSTMQFIDEENLPVGEVIDYDYEHANTKKRLKNFIKNPFDGFSYGLFRTEAIRGVRFRSDIMKETFVEKLMTALEQNSTYVAAFSTMQFIDEENLPVGEVIDYDYEHANTKKRLKNFIKNPFDGFGYGLFRTEAIRGVRFPIWVWPNKKVSWNNIYPTLCFY